IGGSEIKNGEVNDEMFSHVPDENCNVSIEGKMDKSHVEEKQENGNGDNSYKAAGKEGINISYANIARKNNLDNKLNLIPTEINEDGVEVVIFDEEIMVNGKPMFVQKWDPSVSLDKTEPNKLPLWVRLRNLPLEAWTVKGISVVASRLGNPLIMDQTTANMCKTGYGRVGFARVLIDVEAVKGLPEKIEIVYKNRDGVITGKKSVDVNYDWSPPVCSFCKVFGHCEKNCVCRPKSVDEVMEKEREELRNKQNSTDFEQVRYKKKGDKKLNQGNGKKDGKVGVKSSNVEYKRVEKESTKEQLVDKGSPKTGWKVQNDIIDSIRKSANKYYVLQDNDEGIGDNVDDKQDEDSDVYEDEIGSAGKREQSITVLMDLKIAAWNIRGLGKVKKQNAVKNLIMNEGLSMCAVLETRLKGDKVKRIRDKVFGRWEWVDNAQVCKRGCRILIRWNNAAISCGVVHATCV
ncbi:RNA-directed DNA polymerase, eukaryota, reverse transcriptase zinc-binding domain protein, partial [Tanacetum coccineum]